MGLLDRYRRGGGYTSNVRDTGSEEYPGGGGIGGPASTAPQPPPGEAAPPATTAPTGARTGAGAGSGGSGLSGAPRFAFPVLPGFDPPEFAAPTFQDALNEPGYRFRSQAGLDAIEGSAAARGVLRTGGTLKDLGAWNQDFASQEYGNVYNRALSSFDRTYRGAYDQFSPKMTEYSLRGNAAIQGELARYNREWQQYQFDNRGFGGGGGMPDQPLSEEEYSMGGGRR